MSNALVKILLIGLLLLAVTVPFAGLAPLMIFLLIWGVGSGLWSLLQTLLIGNAEPDRHGLKKMDKKSA